MFNEVKDAVTSLPSEAYNFFYAFVIRLLLILYDKKETRPIRILLEILMCGFAGMGVGWGVDAMGGGESMARFAATVVGYIGHQELRRLTLKYLNDRVDRK